MTWKKENKRIKEAAQNEDRRALPKSRADGISLNSKQLDHRLKLLHDRAGVRKH